ncbi:unnamed protein product, partial [Linum tenue]
QEIESSPLLVSSPPRTRRQTQTALRSRTRRPRPSAARSSESRTRSKQQLSSTLDRRRLAAPTPPPRQTAGGDSTPPRQAAAQPSGLDLSSPDLRLLRGPRRFPDSPTPTPFARQSSPASPPLPRPPATESPTLQVSNRSESEVQNPNPIDMTASTSRKPSKQKNVGGATNTNTDSQQIPVEEVHVSEKDSSAGDAPVEVEGAAARPGSTTKKNLKPKRKEMKSRAVCWTQFTKFNAPDGYKMSRCMKCG